MTTQLEECGWDSKSSKIDTQGVFVIASCHFVFVGRGFQAHDRTAEEKPSHIMASDKRAFLFTFWSLLAAGAFPVDEAVVRNYFVEDLRRGVSNAVLDLSLSKTGYLLFADEREPFSCDILLMPESGSSVILSLYMYVPDPDDHIIIEDSDGMAVSLEGSWVFVDGQKSLVSDGKMILRYSTNASSPDSRRRIKYRFLFTQARSGPCRSDEFQCLNRKCIPHHLKCDGHNHCGDNSYIQECANVEDHKAGFSYSTVSSPTFNHMVQTRTSISILLGVVVSLFIVGMAVTVIVLLAQKLKKKKKESATQRSATTTSPTPTAPPDEAPPSAFARFRQSLLSPKRFSKTTSAPAEGIPRPKVCQVPSMYPEMPVHSQAAVPDASGVENPEFKPDV